METMMRNVFKVGPQVSGPSFIGRKEWIKKLTGDLYDSNCSISLVGPTRMGKSSLVDQVLACNEERTDRLVVKLCMGEYSKANMFWLDLLEQLREVAEDAGLWNEKMEACYDEVASADILGEMWIEVYKRNIRKVFKQLKKTERRVLLVIDEFDAVVNVFGNDVASYMILRSLYSETDKYNANGIIISRRTLKFMEQKTTSLSTLHGVFTRETLGEFDDVDMEEYYRVLEDSGVSMTFDGKAQLGYYTGGNPYLCSMFGQRLVTGYPQTKCADFAVVENIYKERKASIEEYYDDLIARLEADKHLEPLIYLSLGAMQQMVDGSHLETMHSLGVLRFDECIGHYAYSADFMKYLKTKPLNIPHWQLYAGVEAALKRLLGRAYPELETTTCVNIRNAEGLLIKSELSRKYPGLKLQWPVLEQAFASLAGYKRNPSVLDALAFDNVVSGILEDWDRSFCHHFGGNYEWRAKLQLICELYSPLAGANSQYVTQAKLATCSQYCQELLLLGF